MALVRLKSAWLAPEHGRDDFFPRDDVITCSFLREDGLHLVFLALSGIDDVLSVFRSDKEGNIVLFVSNDSPEVRLARIIVAVGLDHDCTLAATMYHARKVLRDASVMKSEGLVQRQERKDGLRPAWFENWYDGLTYCTWNGLGQQLSEELILDALESLKRNNIHSQSM